MKPLKFFIVFVLLCSFAPSPKAVKLQYTFAVGDQYEWVQTTTQTVKQSIMGMDQLVENNIKGSMSFKVTSLTSTGAVLEVRYISLSMAMKLPGGMGSQALDSDGDQEKTENKVMKALIDKPFSITLTKQGVVESIENEENLWSGLSSLGLSEQQLASMKTNLEQSLSENALKSSFELVLTNYPEKPVKAGDTWKNSVGTGSSFPLITDNTWSFVNAISENANLTATGTTTTTDKQKVVNLPNGIKSTFDLGGTQKQTSTVNIKSGWPSVVSVNSEIKGTMNLLAGGVIPQDMQVPMTINTVSEYKITKK